MTIRTRAAVLEDYHSIRQYDDFIGDRRIDLQAGELLVADYDKEPAVGYARISPVAFLGWPLLAILSVRDEFQRKGVGCKLLKFAINDSRYLRLYTTTEESNHPMKKLLLNIQANCVGYADQLNFTGERELLYRLK